MLALEKEITASEYSFTDEQYYREKYRLTFTPIAKESFTPECHSLQAKLYECREIAGWSNTDMKYITLAEMVMIESLEWKIVHKQKTRFDEKAWATHLYRVALAGAQAGESPSQIIKRLLHDTIEDTKENENGYQITEEMLTALFGDFDPKIAHSVQLLSKLKTNYQDRDNALETHKRLYALVQYDPESIAIKLDDRIDYFETSGKMNRRKVKSKAIETMEYYWPLAIGFGWHYKAKVLSDACLEKLTGQTKDSVFKFTTEQYDVALERLEQEAESFLASYEHFGWKTRYPTKADGYSLTQGRVEKFSSAWIPAFMTIIIDEHAPIVSNTSEGIFDHVAFPFVKQLLRKNLITQQEFNNFLQQITSGVERTMHIDIEVQGVPIRLRFATSADEAKWLSCISDIVSTDPNRSSLKEFAIEKREEFKQMFEYYTGVGVSGYKLLQNIKDCLIRGTTTVFMDGGEEIVLPSHSTSLDLALAYSSSRSDPKIADIQILKGTDWISVPLGAETQEHATYKIIYEKKNQITIRHLDYVQTKFGKDQIISLVKRHGSRGSNEKYEITRDSVLYGAELIKRLYRRYAAQRGVDERLQIDIFEAYPLYAHLHGSKFGNTKKIQKLVSLLLKTAHREIPIDSGRSSLLWEIVEHLYTKQRQLIEIQSKVPDVTGQLAKVSSIFAKMRVNIHSLRTRSDYELSRRGTMEDVEILVTLRPEDFKQYNKLQGDLLVRKYMLKHKKKLQIMMASN